MSEPLRTAEINALQTFGDQTSRPFASKTTETYASLGRLDPYSTIKNRLFSFVGLVKPVRLTFERISSSHGRSMTEAHTSQNVIWGGPLPGDVFGAINVKGTEMKYKFIRGIKIRPSHYSPHGIDAIGLVDDACVSRVAKVSEFMRKNGLPTEKPVAIKKIKEVFVKDEKTRDWTKQPIDEWKREQLERIRKYYKENADPTILPNPEDVERYFRETNFVAIERDVQLDERLSDIRDNITNKHNLLEFMKPIFKWLNTVSRVRNGDLITGMLNPDRFEYSRNGLVEYFQKFLPSHMGTYLGIFHSLGLRHGFLHDQNWSVAGTVYDLDSVGGNRLYSDDAPSTNKDYINDLITSFISLSDLLRDLKSCPDLKNIDIESSAKDLFLKSYFEQRYGERYRPDQLSNEEQEFLYNLKSNPRQFRRGIF